MAENLEKLTTNLEKIITALSKTSGETEKSSSKFELLDRKISALQSTSNTLLKTMTSIGATVAGVFGGEAVINSVAKYNKNLFDVSKNLNLAGQSMKDFDKAQANLTKTTALSRQEQAALFNEMSKTKGIRLTTELYEKTTQTLTKAFGPALEDISQGWKDLQAVQANYPSLLEKINKGMSNKEFLEFTNTLRQTKGATDDQIDTLRTYYDVVNGGGKIINAETEKYIKVKEVLQKLKAVGEDLLIRFGEPLAEMFATVGEQVGNFAKYVDGLMGNDSFKTMVKILGGVVAGGAAISSIGGVFGGIKGIFGGDRGSQANPMYVKNVGGLEQLALGGKNPAAMLEGGLANPGLIASIARIAIPLVIAAGVGLLIANQIGGTVDVMDEAERLRNAGGVKERSMLASGKLQANDPELVRQLRVAEAVRSSLIQNAKSAGVGVDRNQLNEAEAKVQAARDRLNDSQTVGPASKNEAAAAALDEQLNKLRELANLYESVINPALAAEGEYLRASLDSSVKFNGNIEEAASITKDYVTNLKTQLDGTKTFIKLSQDAATTAEDELKRLMAQKGIYGDIGTLKKAAIQGSKEEQNIAEKLSKAQQALLPLKKQQLEIENAIRVAQVEGVVKAVDSRIELEEKSYALDEARLRLNEAMLGPMGANFELRGQMFDTLSKEIALIDKKKQRVMEEIKSGQDTVANRKLLLDYESERIGKLQKQVDLSKSLRDGYLNALTSFNNVEGAFSKLIITRENGLGKAMRDFGAAQGLSSGAIGAGGTNPFLRWGPDGSLRMDNANQADQRAKGYQNGYDSLAPGIMKNFGVGVNPLQQNAAIGGMNVSPLAGTTGTQMVKSNDPVTIMLGKIVENTGGTKDILSGKAGGVQINTAQITGNTGMASGMDAVAMKSFAISQATKEIEADKAQQIQKAMSAGKAIPNFDDAALNNRRALRAEEIMKTQFQNDAKVAPAVNRSMMKVGEDAIGYDGTAEVDTIGSGGRTATGQVVLNFNIKGDNVGTIMKEVNDKLGKELSEMMAPSGGTGRNYDFQTT